MKRTSALSKLEMIVMKPFWEKGSLSVREASEYLEDLENGPDYSTVQTIVGRLEKKSALKRMRKIGNAWLFEACVERDQIVGGLIDDVINLLGGSSSPIMSHLVDSEKIGKAELEEIRAMILKKEQRKGEGD
jgi:BlaI family penicillinase repressor